MTDVDNLQKFGTQFQVKCIVALLNDKPFLEQVVDVVQVDFFESDAHKWIVDRIFWYFGSYRALPSMEVFKKEIAKVTNDVLKASAISQLREIYTSTNQTADDLKYVKDEFLAFCKNQALKNAILKSVDYISKGDYNSIKVIVDKALQAGAERNVGHVYLEEGDQRWNKIARNTIATPWECINEITDGGLGAGELGCIVAPSGIGKSWVLSALGTAAMLAGKKVAHYTFELSQEYVGLRYDSIVTGIEPNKVSENRRVVQEKMEQITGQLFIKYFPTRSITINSIAAHVQRLQNRGHAPDLLLIDYADLMMSNTRSNARHEELGYIHEEIRGLLGELRIPGWTASQSQRSSLQDDVVEADKIAGAYSKIMTDDFVLSISRKLADKVTNTGRAHAIKNRFGPDGITFPANLDLAHGIVELFDSHSPEGSALTSKMAGGEGQMKALLAKKLIDPASIGTQ